MKITRIPPAPDREELHYSNVAFDSGLRTAREARVADVDTIPKRYRIESAIYDQPSSRLFTAQRKGKTWTRYATAATLRKVSDRHRRILMMFYWEGRTAEEIAEELKCKITYRDGKVWNNMAWVILFRARKELLAIMEKEEKDGAVSAAAEGVSAQPDQAERGACGREDNGLGLEEPGLLGPR